MITGGCGWQVPSSWQAPKIPPEIFSRDSTSLEAKDFTLKSSSDNLFVSIVFIGFKLYTQSHIFCLNYKYFYEKISFL
jgi:hypothetical protein